MNSPKMKTHKMLIGLLCIFPTILGAQDVLPEQYEIDTKPLILAFERAMIEQAACIVEDDATADKVLAQSGISERDASFLVAYLIDENRIVRSPNGEGIRLVHEDCPLLDEGS